MVYYIFNKQYEKVSTLEIKVTEKANELIHEQLNETSNKDGNQEIAIALYRYTARS